MGDSYSKNKHCKCGKLITNYSKYCFPCYRKYRPKPIKNKYYCKDCKKELSRPDAIYCKSCAQKGDRNSAFIKGDTIFPRYCKCGNKKDYRAKLCRFCYYKLNKGKNHGSWQGGLGREPYSWKFNEELKAFIRRRDNYKCKYCNISEINYFRKLDIHHIDYNKHNCNKNNLITLCLSCNSMANYNRDYWFAYFTYILENK